MENIFNKVRMVKVKGMPFFVLDDVLEASGAGKEDIPDGLLDPDMTATICCDGKKCCRAVDALGLVKLTDYFDRDEESDEEIIADILGMMVKVLELMQEDE